jgi:hypothetical protein
MVAALAARNANEIALAPMVGSGGFLIWRVFGVWCQAVGFLLVSGVSSREDGFKIDVGYFMKTIYKCCTFSAIFKDSVLLLNTTKFHSCQD